MVTCKHGNVWYGIRMMMFEYGYVQVWSLTCKYVHVYVWSCVVWSCVV